MKGTRGTCRGKGAAAGTAPVPSVERREEEKSEGIGVTGNNLYFWPSVV